MPKASPIQTNFGGGEFSPTVQGRVDSERYKTGLDVSLNYFPNLQGSLTRRPGTKFCSTVKDSTKPPRLVRFEFSQTQAYILEFGDQYIQFYANNGQVITAQTTFDLKITSLANVLSGQTNYATRNSNAAGIGETINSSTTISMGNTLFLTTPYRIADVGLLKFTQSADTLYITHPSYPPYKLQRQDQNYWSLTQIFFKDGPYLAFNTTATQNDSSGITLTPSAATGNNLTLTTGPSTSISAIANNGSGLIRVTSTAHGLQTDQKICISGVIGTTEANTLLLGGGLDFWVVTVIDANNIDLVGSVFVHSYISGGSIFPYLFASTDTGRVVRGQEGTSWGWGVITAAIFGHQVDFQIFSTFTNTNPKTIWRLSAWTSALGYPGTVCFHQDRLTFAGATNFPQRIDMSNSSDYENFQPTSVTDSSVADSDALSFNLLSGDVDVVRWVSSDEKGLLAGSTTTEWTVRPSTLSEALSATNINVAQSSFRGTANVQPVKSGKATLYVQRSGRKIREMNYFYQVDGFRSTDLTEISEHITIPSITMLASQRETQPIVWALRSDGALVSITYDRDDLNLRSGCARHILGGQSDSSGTQPIIQSIAVIPSVDGTFDQLWMTVQRYINGASVVTIEYMTKFFDDSFVQEDAYFGDCGSTYDSPITVSGITNASPAVVTATAHGLSNGNQIKITTVVGLSQTTVDSFGTKTTTSLVNEKTFIIAGSTTNTFQLNDFNGNAVSSTAFGSYVSGGQVRKMVTTISGLTWLEGETVSVLADGAEHPDVVVSSSGVIALNYPVAKAQIGYSYNSDGRMLRPEAGSATGSSIGKTRRVHRYSMLLHNTAGLSVGMAFNNLFPFLSTRADVNQADTATPLFSGMTSDALASQYDFEGQLCWRQNKMLPGTISSITLMLEEFDR